MENFFKAFLAYDTTNDIFLDRISGHGDEIPKTLHHLMLGESYTTGSALGITVRYERIR